MLRLSGSMRSVTPCVSSRGICQERPHAADPSQNPEVFVAQGLDKDDHRRGELLELVDGKFEVE
jgi:hypothetical protein